MKKIIKKSLGILLVLFSVLSCFNGCVNGSTFHTHDFKQKADETRHFKECECGEVTDIAEHTFEWITDSEPTYSSPGYKHQECSTCGYKTKEGTMIERKLHETVVYNDVTEFLIYNSLVWHKLKSYTDLKKYYIENKNEQSYSFYCVAPEDNYSEGIKIVDTPTHSPGFYYGSDETDACLVETTFSLFCEELGPSEVPNGIGAVEISIEFRFISIGCNSNFQNITFEFFKYDHSKYKWNYVIKLTDSGKEIGYVYYLTEIDINREWIVNYITSSEMILK